MSSEITAEVVRETFFEMLSILDDRVNSKSTAGLFVATGGNVSNLTDSMKDIGERWYTALDMTKESLSITNVEIIDMLDAEIAWQSAYNIFDNTNEAMGLYDENFDGSEFKTRTTYLYLMESEKSGQWVYKIGLSIDPEKRAKELERGMRPDECTVTVLHAIPCDSHPYIVETILHETFKSKRLIGEWFDLNEDDLNWIMSIAKYDGHTLRDISDKEISTERTEGVG